MAARRDKKRRRGPAPESPEQMVFRVVMAFLHWLDDHPTTVLPIEEHLIQVTTLANAKAIFGVPNPAGLGRRRRSMSSSRCWPSNPGSTPRTSPGMGCPR